MSQSRRTPGPSKQRGLLLPPPTASEAAFERLLAHFDAGGDATPAAYADAHDAPVLYDEVVSPASPGSPASAPALAHDDPDAAFLSDLFAHRAEYLGRERYAGIGDADGFNTKVVGVSFEGRQHQAAGVVPGHELELERQPHNEHDPNAVAVRYGLLQLGFIKREIARRIAPNIDAGDTYGAVVTAVTGGGERNVGVNIYVRRRRTATLEPEALGERAGNASDDDLRRALIGDRPFREQQRAVLDLVDARRNTLAVLGTGRGKSVCFQYPAARRALRAGERTLVFYPLRALANDQYDALTRRLGRFGVRVLRASGAIDGVERARLDAALSDGSWDIILATPEFVSYHRAAFARACNRPNLVVVDEAHHVHDSRHRHAYATLETLVTDLGNPPVLALTATAAEDAFREIARKLAIDAWVIDPTVRANLHVVDARNTSDKTAYLARELGEGKAIVYCNSRAEAGKIAERLRARFGDSVAYYHAGVPGAERARVEELFRSGRVSIVVATSAFGEGIDLPDVRDIVLYQLNLNFTQFNQMAGRAGRDGLDARIHLLYGESDRSIGQYIVGLEAPSVTTLRELYRGLRGLAWEHRLRMSYDDIAGALEIELVKAQTINVAVAIFVEAGLIELENDEGVRVLRFVDPAPKVDVTATARYAEAQAERDAFERFCDLAMTASAATLEQFINRPIYPDGVPLRKR